MHSSAAFFDGVPSARGRSVKVTVSWFITQPVQSNVEIPLLRSVSELSLLIEFKFNSVCS